MILGVYGDGDEEQADQRASDTSGDDGERLPVRHAVMRATG
jgi:hypothetical protein